MLNNSQKSEIANYLLGKKLPIDIMLEVQDHFISQINDLELNEDLNFDEAFKKVKETWRKELTLSWKGEMSLMDSTDFMRNMSREIVRSNVSESLKLVIPYVLGIFFLANVTTEVVFKIAFIIIISLPFLYCIINYIKNYHDFRLSKNNHSHILTLHQDGILWFVLTLSPFLNIFRYIFDDSNELQNMLVFNFNGMEILNVILGFLFLIFLFGGIAYSIVCQRKYVRQIKKVKVFLNEHQFS